MTENRFAIHQSVHMSTVSNAQCSTGFPSVVRKVLHFYLVRLFLTYLFSSYLGPVSVYFLFKRNSSDSISARLTVHCKTFSCHNQCLPIREDGDHIFRSFTPFLISAVRKYAAKCAHIEPKQSVIFTFRDKNMPSLIAVKPISGF